MSATLQLAQQLIARRSITPDDGGCQPLIAARLAPLGFAAEAISRNGTTNSGCGEAPCGRWWCSPSHRCCATRSARKLDFRSVRADPAVGRAVRPWRCRHEIVDRAFVVAAEQFVRAHPTHAGSIALLLTSDEEGAALDGTIAVVERLRERAEQVDCCIVGEPTSVQR